MREAHLGSAAWCGCDATASPWLQESQGLLCRLLSLLATPRRPSKRIEMHRNRRSSHHLSPPYLYRL